MKYFMFVWQPKSDCTGHFDNSGHIRTTIEKNAGKQSMIDTQSSLNASIASIGEKLTVLTCLIDNVVFFETQNHEITENGITSWLNSLFNKTHSILSGQWFVKEVLDPYPVS